MHVRDCSCAPILQFFSAESDGATADFRHFRSSLRKDNEANYGQIWTLQFLASV